LTEAVGSICIVEGAAGQARVVIGPGKTYRVCPTHAEQARALGYRVYANRAEQRAAENVHFPDGGTNGMIGYVRCGNSGALHPADHCPNGEDA